MTIRTGATTDPRPSLSPAAGLRLIVGVAVVVASFVWGLPAFASYADVGPLLTDVGRNLGPGSAIALALVAGFNLIAPALSQTAALPGLDLRRAVWTDWSSTTLTNLIPGGSALAVGLVWTMYRSFGVARSAVARTIVVTGVWDVLVKLGTPLLALAWLSTQRPVDNTFMQAALIGGALFVGAATLLAVLLGGRGTARRLGRLVDAVPVVGDGWGGRLEHLRTETVALLRDRGWMLTVLTLAGHGNLYLLLVISLRAVGVDRSALGWAPVLAAFAFGRLVTALPITPGGLGVMEVGLTGALTTVAAANAGAAVGTATVDGAQLVAGVLLFRFLSFALPLPLGAVGLVVWQTRRR